MGQQPTATDGQDDLAILHPERFAEIAGVEITMREYSFAESLKHHALITALADAMTDIALAGAFHDLDSLRSAFGENSEIVLRLIAIACDQPLAWVQTLNDADGQALFMLWWGVNADFFLKRVLLSVQLHKLRQLRGATLSPPSSALDTTPLPSGATPSVN